MCSTQRSDGTGSPVGHNCPVGPFAHSWIDALIGGRLDRDEWGVRWSG
jgi:hypothetical protein